MVNRFIRIVFFFILICAGSVKAQVVHRLEGDRFTHYRSEDWVSYAPALDVTSIDIDPSYIYFATRTGGILRFDPFAEKWEYPFTTSNGLRSNAINRVVYDYNTGRLYAMTSAGLDEYNFAEQAWHPSFEQYIPNPGRPSSLMAPDSQELAMNRFPPLFRPGNSMLPDFFTPVSMMFVPPDNIYDQYNRLFRFTDRITDSWQRVWIGTNGFGPLEADLYTFRMKSHQQSIGNISPRDIFIDGDFMWIGGLGRGTEIGGITEWNRHDDEWLYHEAQMQTGISRDAVNAITGNYDYIAFATDLGVVLYQPDDDRWRTISVFDGLNGDYINDVVADDRYIYAAGTNGFNWIDPVNRRVYELNSSVLDNVEINQLALDESLMVWAASRFGLYSIDLKNETAQFHATRASISDYNLTAVEVIGDEIWFAGSYGIAYWNRKTDDWHSFPALQISTAIHDIASTKNAVWFATDNGLLKFDRGQNYWRLFTEADGLINRKVYHIEVEDQYLWLSTNLGITRFRWKRKGRID